MLTAGYIAFSMLPEGMTFGQTFQYAGEVGKLNLINLSFNLSDRYNIWSGLIGGLFLFLSYFGADQSQVGRYLGGSSITESRLGLLFNGLLKIPMQFIILYIGILIFVFYQFHQAPLVHNQPLLNKAMATEANAEIRELSVSYDEVYEQRKLKAQELVSAIQKNDRPGVEKAKADMKVIQSTETELRTKTKVPSVPRCLMKTPWTRIMSSSTL